MNLEVGLAPPPWGLKDIPIRENIINYEKEKIGQVDLYKFDSPTNGIGYFIASFNVGHIDKEDLIYLPIFCTLLTQVGTKNFSYLEMAEKKEAGTGGIDATVSILENPSNINDCKLYIKIKGKALVQKQAQLFEILKEICLNIDFGDLERIKTVIGQVRISMENSIHHSGHLFAMRAGAAKLTLPAYLKEIFSGLSQISHIKKLSELSDKNLKDLSIKMKKIADAICCNNFSCDLSVEKVYFNNDFDISWFLLLKNLKLIYSKFNTLI